MNIIFIINLRKIKYVVLQLHVSYHHPSKASWGSGESVPVTGALAPPCVHARGKDVHEQHPSAAIKIATLFCSLHCILTREPYLWEK